MALRHAERVASLTEPIVHDLGVQRLQLAVERASLPGELGNGRAVAELDHNDVGVVRPIALLVRNLEAVPLRLGEDQLRRERPEDVALRLVGQRELVVARHALVTHRLVDARLAGVVGSERERPLGEPLSQLAEVGERGGGGALGIAPLVPARGDGEPVAPGRRRDELPDAEGARVRVGARQERALDDGHVLEIVGQPRPRELALDVREVAGAALEPEDHLGGIPQGQEKLPLEALRHVPPPERHGLAGELEARRQRKGVERPGQARVDGLEAAEPRPQLVELLAESGGLGRTLGGLRGRLGRRRAVQGRGRRGGEEGHGSQAARRIPRMTSGGSNVRATRAVRSSWPGADAGVPKRRIRGAGPAPNPADSNGGAEGDRTPDPETARPTPGSEVHAG